MVTSGVLKVPQSDHDKEFVLLQALSSGKRPLDLKLIGTEGEAPEASITITIRKQVQGITQRLGTITLSHDANEAIELFEWCAASADAVVASNEATAQIQSKATELEASIHQLKEQLEELLKAKDEDETALLQKFRDLLNEKKVKIREQQKVLASGSFSAPKQEEPREPCPESEPDGALETKTRGRKPAATRARKRKAAAPAKEESDEEDVAGEQSPIKSEPEDTDDGQTTEATASVDGDSDDDEEMADNGGDGAAAPPPPRESSPPKKTAAPPPKRALPFANRKPKDAPKPVAQAGGADTDSDDEL
ncbi:hypothetical protein G3M48_002589 [Beauveria asiatica]|uniref:XRCC4 coiled-coil domain-containing protein n=1 Tax=Beauveria asiatica TaxID=1069075 RepID=A0AAW0RX39_9HYPO